MIRMSRELLVIAAIAVLCIIVSPFYKDTQLPKLDAKPKYVEKISKTYEVVKTNYPMKIVHMGDSFLPITYAGSEISSYETLKYLKERGHDVSVIIKSNKVKEYDGIPVYEYNKSDPECIARIVNADCLFFLMGGSYKDMDEINMRTKPTFMFVHIMNSYAWLIQQPTNFPIVVVYNSRTTQNHCPTHHDNMVMVPYVETGLFKPLRAQTQNNTIVTLINCNINKGGPVLREIAAKMKHVKFLGVKGGYSKQLLEDDESPKNITYIDTQKDVTVVYKRTGILLMPSKDETWGRTAVEAMSSGIPVIHSEAPGLVECVGGAGILCPRNDTDAWCRAIQRILDSPAYKEKLRENGFRRVEEIEILQRRGRLELAKKVEEE